MILLTMPITESLERLILASASALEIKQQSESEGVLGLRRAGLKKVRQGITSLEEVLGCTNE